MWNLRLLKWVLSRECDSAEAEEALGSELAVANEQAPCCCIGDLCLGRFNTAHEHQELPQGAQLQGKAAQVWPAKSSLRSASL